MATISSLYKYDPRNFQKPVTQDSILGLNQPKAPVNPLTGSGGASMVAGRSVGTPAPIQQAPAPVQSFSVPVQQVAPPQAPTPTFNASDFQSTDPAVQAKIAQMQAQATQQAPQTPQAPIAPQAPANTIGDVYKTNIDPNIASADQSFVDILKEQTQPVNEEEIRRKTMQQFQAEIDTLERLYANKKAEAAIQGQGLLGSNRAIQGRRGLLGSDFGASQTAEVEKRNTAVQSALDVEKANRIASIQSNAAKMAQAEIDAKTAARKAGAQEYINFLAGASKRKEESVAKSVADLVALGVSDDASMQSIADTLGVTPQMVMAEYNRQIAQAQPEQAKPVVVAPGSSIFDPSTGSFLGTAPERPADNKPVTQNIGGNLLQWNPASGGWQTVYSAPESASQKIVKINGVDYVQNADGSYTNPNVPVAQNEAVTLKEQALTSAQELMKKFEAGEGTSAVGKSALLQFQHIPGTKPYNFNVLLQNLKSLLSLDNVKFLKGQGAVSDAERALLERASSKLDAGLTEAEFQKTLQEMITGLSGAGANPQQGQIQDIDQFLNSFDKPLSKGINGSVQQIASAIKKVESNGNYQAKGASGEFGAYQFMPATWSGWAKQYLGNANAPMTQENQDKVAHAKINDLLSQGYDAKQIALIWNGGTPVEKKGVNSKGVAYDSGAYARKVLNALG